MLRANDISECFSLQCNMGFLLMVPIQLILQFHESKKQFGFLRSKEGVFFTHEFYLL